MSLELRMNAIIGYSEILTEDATDNQHQEYIPDLKKIFLKPLPIKIIKKMLIE